MKILKYISYLCLAVVLLAPVLFYTGTISNAQMEISLLAGTIVWFATASTWMNKEEKVPKTESPI
jgi:uncharacterized RDD family membrane protein YckC